MKSMKISLLSGKVSVVLHDFSVQKSLMLTVIFCVSLLFSTCDVQNNFVQ